MKYEIGDWVCILDGSESEEPEGNYSEWLDSFNDLVGKISQITATDSSDLSYKLALNEEWFAESWLKPATQVKVGDWVRVKPATELSNPSDYPRAGGEYSVVSINTEDAYHSSGYRIRLGMPGWSTGYPIGSEDVIVLNSKADEPFEPEPEKEEEPMPEMTTSATMTPAKFKVGDKIVVHTEITKGHDAYLRDGWTGKIIEIQDSLGYYHANLEYGRRYVVNITAPEEDDASVGWNIGENNLKLKGTSLMSSTTNLVNAKLSPDERYARQNGLKNADGTVTSAGKEALAQYLWDAEEKNVVKALKAADKALRAAKAADAAELESTPE